MTRFLVLTAAVTLGVVWQIPEARAQESAEERPSGFFIDGAYGFTTVRGNDVYVGDRTTISFRGVFAESPFERLVTEMSSEWMPYLRAGYVGEVWGVEGEFRRVATGGELGGAFEQDDVVPRIAMVRIWDWWHGEDNEAASYAATNDLMQWNARFDVTRSLTPQLSLALGLHLAKLENERAEQVTLRSLFAYFDVRRATLARMDGLLVGPSVGVRGTSAVGGAARLNYALTQSVLLGSADHEGDLAIGFVGFLPRDISATTSFSSRASVPVTDLRLSFAFNVGDHVSIGALGLVSAWFNVPAALEFSAAFEEWDEVERTLIFASIGPMVTIRF